MTVTADRLAHAMDRRGYDQSRLARALSVSQGSISKILLGKTANSRLLPRIATKLGVPLPWLLGMSDELDESDDDHGADVTGEERELLALMRGLDDEQRKAVTQLMRTLAKSPTPPPPVTTVHDKQHAYRAEKR